MQITGDGADGEKTLADISRNLALFAREEAEAAAYIDTEEAEAELDELKAKLEKFKAADATAEVNVKIAKAEADLAKLQAELDKVDHEDVWVDVDVKKGNVDRLAALSRDVEGLGKDLEGAQQNSNTFSNALESVFMFAVENAGLAAKGLAVFLITGVVAALAAAGASLTEAVGGAGALAIAFGATIPAGVALGIGAIARFKEESGTAGTAAYELKEAASGIWTAFKGATAEGADAVFRGITHALGDLTPVVESLAPAFTKLGEAGGSAFELLAKEFSSPYWQHFFAFITESLAQLTPLLAHSFGALAVILAHIAQASMPFLISGLRQIAQWLESIGDATSNISELRGGVGELVGQLKAWLDLAKAVGQVFLGFIEAAAPQGKAFVEWLTRGAEALAEWERSKSGREEIHEFFHAVLPLAKETIVVIAKLVVAFLQIEQLVAPALATIVGDIGKLLDAVETLIAFVSQKFPAVGLIILGWISPIALVAKSFPAIKDAAEDAWDFVKQKASDVTNFVVTLVGKPILFVVNFADDVASRARDLWNRVKGEITDRIEFLLSFASDVASRARDLWDRVKSEITDRIEFLLSLPDDLAARARSIWDSVKGVVNDTIGFVFSLPDDIVGRARDLWGDVKNVINDGIDFVLNVPHVVVGAAQEIWGEVKEIMSKGIDLVVHVVADLSELPGKIAHELGFANGVEDLLRSTFALVGERGPELAFIPQGADIYDAGATRNILKALGKGGSLQSAVTTNGESLGAGGNRVEHNEYNLSVSAPGTGSPDPDITLALWGQKLRARGVRA